MGSLQGEKRYGFGAAACAGRNSGEGCFCVLESSLAARSLWIQMGAFSPETLGCPAGSDGKESACSA